MFVVYFPLETGRALCRIYFFTHLPGKDCVTKLGDTVPASVKILRDYECQYKWKSRSSSYLQFLKSQYGFRFHTAVNTLRYHHWWLFWHDRRVLTTTGGRESTKISFSQVCCNVESETMSLNFIPSEPSGSPCPYKLCFS